MEKHVVVSDELHSLMLGINANKKVTDIDYSEMLDYLFFTMNQESLNHIISCIHKMKERKLISTKLSSNSKHIKISKELHSLLYKIKTMKGLKYNDILEGTIFGLGFENFQRLYEIVYCRKPKNPVPFIFIENICVV